MKTSEPSRAATTAGVLPTTEHGMLHSKRWNLKPSLNPQALDGVGCGCMIKTGCPHAYTLILKVSKYIKWGPSWFCSRSTWSKALGYYEGWEGLPLAALQPMSCYVQYQQSLHPSWPPCSQYHCTPLPQYAVYAGLDQQWHSNEL